MYYPPPANSPKHDQSLWSRSSAYNPYVNGGPPPPPPPPPPQPAIHHQHHSSIHQVFPLTPPTQSTQQVNMLQNGSPQQQPPPLSHHWQSQLLKAEVIPNNDSRESSLSSSLFFSSYVDRQVHLIIVLVHPPWPPEIPPRLLSPSPIRMRNYSPHPSHSYRQILHPTPQALLNRINKLHQARHPLSPHQSQYRRRQHQRQRQ